MDNISHAVVSLVAGELLHRSIKVESTPEKQARRQKLVLFTAAAAGNFPDLDLFLYPLLKKPLGYLLHHRGHSHTIVGVCFEALLLFALTWTFWPHARQLLRESSLAKKAYASAVVIGFALHLSMDWLNSYGLHPFYPFNSNWFYGDLVFIVEPVFWIAFGVPVAFLTRRWWLRYPLLSLVLGVPFVATVKGFFPAISFGVLALIAAALASSQTREHARGRLTLFASFAIGLAFIIGQAFASSNARALLTSKLQSYDPKARVLDAALTAYPSNPLCWSFVTIDVTGETYRLRNGVISLASSLVRPESCPQLLGRNGGESKALGEDILELSEESGSITGLRNLDSQNCHLHAWMRFARMPFVTEHSASDLRFSRGAKGNFTSLDFEDFKDEPCSPWIPLWEPPRADLLNK